MIIAVRYPEISLGGAPAVVEPLHAEEACRLAPAILGLIVSAYAKQFEGAGGPLPNGVFVGKYGSKDAVKRFQETVIPDVFARGGCYLAIRHARNRSSLLASLKVMPGGIAEDYFQDKAGIGEILTDPLWQGRRLGSGLLHAYLRQHAPQDAGIVLDSFVDSPVNAWYRRLGFIDEGDSGFLHLGRTHKLPTRYMVTAENIHVSDVVDTLERLYPPLRTSTQVEETY